MHAVKKLGRVHVIITKILLLHQLYLLDFNQAAFPIRSSKSDCSGACKKNRQIFCWVFSSRPCRFDFSVAEQMCRHFFYVSGFSHIAKTDLFFPSSVSSSVSVSCSHVPAVLSFLCNRYQTPECDGAARSRVSDTEDPFQGRDLTGFLHFSMQSKFTFGFGIAEIFLD